MTAQTFTINEIGLHRRVFIITLDMIKLQKYSYTVNISYRTKRKKSQPRLKSNVVAPLQHLPPFTFNMSGLERIIIKVKGGKC